MTVNPYEFMEELSKQSKDGDIVIADSGANLCWTMQGYKIRHKVRLFSAFNHSTMGYSLPASIGAQIACPSSRVIAIMGDGALSMNIQELGTIAHHNLPIKIFVMNNHGYGMIKQTQDDWLKSRYVATDKAGGLGLPDILRVARAYDLDTALIEDNEGLGLVKSILEYPNSILCEVSINPNEKIKPKLLFGKKLEEIE